MLLFLVLLPYFAALSLILLLIGCVRAIRKKGKGLLVLGGAMALSLLLLGGALLYVSDYQPHALVSYASGDQAHQLVIEQLGEPGFPFGDVKCRLTLTDGKHKIGTAAVRIPNDGGDARPDNFTVSWDESHVSVVACGDESVDASTIVLPFDGSAS